MVFVLKSRLNKSMRQIIVSASGSIKKINAINKMIISAFPMFINVWISVCFFGFKGKSNLAHN